MPGVPLRCFRTTECSQIVHRDIKAPNVLLREAEGCYDVCISDFGTATAAMQAARPWLRQGLGSV